MPVTEGYWAPLSTEVSLISQTSELLICAYGLYAALQEISDLRHPFLPTWGLSLSYTGQLEMPLKTTVSSSHQVPIRPTTISPGEMDPE